MVAAPKHIQHVAERRLAHLAADPIAVNCQHLLDGLEALTAQDFAEVVLGEWKTFADSFLNFFLKFRCDGLQELLTDLRTASTASRSAGAFFELGKCVDTPLMNGSNNCAFGHAHTAANCFGVRHVCGVQAFVLCRNGKKELAAEFCEIGPRANPFHIAVTGSSVADKNCTR